MLLQFKGNPELHVKFLFKYLKILNNFKYKIFKKQVFSLFYQNDLLLI